METKELLRYQRLFRKTSSGRDIDCAHIIGGDAEKTTKEAVSMIMEKIDSLTSSTEQPEGGMAECINCKLLLDEASFYNGCPNCGCKDYDTEPSSSEVRRQD
jgi:hypothetical protein